MTSAPTVSEYLGTGKCNNKDRKPEFGTNLRMLYDHLRLYGFIKSTKHQSFSANINRLREYYRMNIKKCGNSKFTYQLLGEWIGDDYVAIEQIMAEELDNEH